MPHFKQLLPPYLNRISANRISTQWLIVIISCVGVLLRLHQYFLNRSLWIDEAFVAINLLNRSYGELLQPLDYNQGAPYGFLVIERLSLDILGTSEWALRLFPLVSSLVALFLFIRVAGYFCDRVGLIVSFSLLALCDRAIYYSSELKQYSSDLMLTLLLYYCLLGLLPHRLSWRNCFIFAGVGAIAVWISHPAVFLIAGTGLWLIGEAALNWQRQPWRWQQLCKYIVSFALPAGSFVSFYVISISKLVDNSALQQSWSEGHDSFMPLPPTSLNELKWFFDTFFEIFNYPVGISLTGIAALMFVAGVIALWQRQRQTFGLLLMPIAVTLFASGLNKYPFKGQLLLFLVPSILMIIGCGVATLWQWTRRVGSESVWLSYGIAILLLTYPIYHAALNLNKPSIPPSFEYQRVREDIKPVLAYIQTNWQADDTLYVYYSSQYALRYYGNRYGFDLTAALPDRSTEPYSGPWYQPALISSTPPVVVGQYARLDWSIAEQEIEQLDGRVWALFSHAYDRRSDLDEEDAFLYLLDRRGVHLDEYTSVEAAAYLYQF